MSWTNPWCTLLVSGQVKEEEIEEETKKRQVWWWQREEIHVLWKIKR
jgi:hypothetical protein